MKSNKISFIRIIALLLIFACFTGLFGCRPSSALTEVIYTDDAQTDKNQQSRDNDKDNSNQDDDISSKKEIEDALKDRNYDYSGAVKGKGNSKKIADDESYNEKGEDRDTADANSKPKTTNINTENNKNTGSVEQDEIFPTTDERVLRQIVDGTGRRVDIPQNVNTVAAVGDIALYVEMLGGKNRIVASSEDFKNNRFASTVFGGSEMAGIQQLWSNDGSTAMLDSNFKKLVAIKPDVCFVVSGQTTFSDSQLEKLGKHFISVVTLPKLNTTTNIKTAVTVLAEVLGDKSAVPNQKNAQVLASQYISWYDSLIDEVKAKDHTFGGTSQYNFNNDYYVTRHEDVDTSLMMDGYYTLYISSWDTSANYTVSNSNTFEFSGIGMAISPSGYSTTSLAYNMSLGGVANVAALAFDYRTETKWFVSPLVPTTRYLTVSGSDAGVWDVDANRGLTVCDTKHIGTEKFKNIIVASSGIKTHIQNDRLWNNYGLITSSSGLVGYGCLDKDGTIMNSNIWGSYNILVNPQGVGRWTSASPESPMESLWINSIYYADYSIDALKGRIKDFYLKFYGYTPSDSMLSSIVNGE